MRIAVVWVLLIIFLSNSSVFELIKLPSLFLHFTEHQQKNTDLTVSKFIAMHYLESDNTSEDDARDAELPFKKESDSQLHYLFVVDTNNIEQPVMFVQCSTKPMCVNTKCVCNGIRHRLFRPPNANC